MIKTRFLDNLNVVVHIGSETVSADEILQAALDWGAHPDFDPGVSTVWDLVAANFEVDWAKVKTHGEATASHFNSVLKPSGRTAWVIADPVVGVVLESIHLAFKWPTPWQTFSSADDAINWAIGIDDSSFQSGGVNV